MEHNIWKTTMTIIPEAGIFSLSSSFIEPTIISHGKIEHTYNKNNPYLFAPIFVSCGESEEMAIAMIDTGANACFISDSLREKMQLKPFAYDKVGNAHEMVDSGVYKTKIQMGKIVLEDVITMEFSNSNFLNADFVIGMNVIMMGDLTICKNGTFRFEI